jgi:DNA polymerase (family 10)
MTNKDVIRTLSAVADLLTLQGADEFRVRGYQRAADALRGLSDDLAAVAARGELQALPGIGRAMAQHIGDLLASGRLDLYDQLLDHIPAGLVQMLEVPELGPKTARRLWQELGLETIEAVEAAAAAGRIHGLKGFGEKSEAKLLANIGHWRAGRERVLRIVALAQAEPLLAAVAAAPGVTQASLAGSLRRGRETIKDLDLLVAAEDGAAAIAALSGHESVAEVVAAGGTKATVRLLSGLNADLRVVPRASWGAALQYFTGSQAHNIALRGRARAAGWSLNEYGLRPVQGETVEPLATEEELYARLGLAWIPPELREDRGELAAAAAGELPQLIELSQIRGDLHSHSRWSDGQNTIAEMAQAARALGHEYLAITDHSKSLTIANGLDEDRVRRQWREIAAAQAAVPEVRLLRGIEVDILPDGRLDLDLGLLAELDVVVASVHTAMGQDAERMTQRLLAAVASGVVDIIGHPTGRLLTGRSGFEFEFGAVAAACAERGVAFELNASPERLDLDDILARRASQGGVRLSINTDAHETAWLSHLDHGVTQARRAWLSAADVINAWPWPQLRGWLER